jgi:hypothetical protein
MRDPQRVVRAVGLAVAMLASLGVSAALADDRMDGGTGSYATLEGRRISLAAAADYSCHDLELPIIRCFATSAELLEAVDELALTGGQAAQSLSSGYVIAYENISYGGAARVMSVSYDNLGSIGWNDRISSFKSFGASGDFREDAPPGGFYFFFGTSSQVSWVGSNYNDKFSSLELD